MSDLVLNELQQGLEELVGRAHERWLNCSDLTLEEAERLGGVLATFARDLGFWLGDLARYTEARWPDTHHQAWPVFQSPGQLARNAGVCRAYPKRGDRAHGCTFSQYMQAAGKPDRQKLLAEMVGKTTDETRGAGPKVPTPEPEAGVQTAPRWLLAIDVHYYLNTFYHSGAGVEAASQVSSWIARTVSRLREKGLTDVVCCFDSPTNNRKELTKDWEHQYKGNRGPKDHELITQLHVVRSLLEKAGFLCFTADGYEADDCIATYAKTFPGKVAILSGDKDMKQCLSGERVVIITDVTWSEDDTSGQMLPTYHWYTEKKHPRIECKNLFDETGLTPQQFPDMQCLMGDSSDNIKGAIGIGEAGAITFIKQYGTVEGVIAAAKIEAPSITPKKREAIIAFESKLEITRQLVTLKTDLTVPNSTRI